MVIGSENLWSPLLLVLILMIRVSPGHVICIVVDHGVGCTGIRRRNAETSSVPSPKSLSQSMLKSVTSVAM